MWRSCEPLDSAAEIPVLDLPVGLPGGPVRVAAQAAAIGGGGVQLRGAGRALQQVRGAAAGPSAVRSRVQVATRGGQVGEFAEHLSEYGSQDLDLILTGDQGGKRA